MNAYYWAFNHAPTLNYLSPGLGTGTATVPEVSIGYWVAFSAMVVVLLVLDLCVFHRKDHEPTLRESALWTVFWAFLALCFDGIIWATMGPDYALEFLNGYLVEWTLSMDNVFVFIVIFAYFRVPLKYQYRVLFWGILGAIIMRLTFILAASQLLHHFEWIFCIFGAFLIYTGVKLSLSQDSEPHPEKNLLMRLARKIFPVTAESHGKQFFARENGKLCVTPLFLVLLVVESTDVIFAVDSVPAIFGVTKVPFIVFTSNVFAILGLRALYFLLAGVMNMFRYLNYGLSGVLVFIGVKMLAEYFFHKQDGTKLVSNGMSLLVIVTLLGTSIIASLLANRYWPEMASEGEPEESEASGGEEDSPDTTNSSSGDE